MLFRHSAEIGFAVSVLFGIWEVVHWGNPGYGLLLGKAQKARRFVGIALLAIVTGMSVYGSYFPEHPGKFGAQVQIVYWGVLMLFALAIPVVAWMEIKATLRRMNSEQLDIYRSVLGAQDVKLSAHDIPTIRSHNGTRDAGMHAAHGEVEETERRDG